MTHKKKKPCKHQWYQTDFIGSPFQFSWECEVEERCYLCNKNRTRHATDEDVNAEKRRLTCKSCGYLLSEHTNKAFENDGCLMLMADLIRDLQDQVRRLYEWKDG